ncbi:MAG: HAD family phosphatase [Lachnospiraceae bacterium]|nr:HAD family phosphatase [Lachnospiraceae bacterium]
MIKDLLKGKTAVLFDLDGTLVDSMWMWDKIDLEFLGRFGLTCPPGLAREIEGMSFSETAIYFKERFHLPLSLDEIKECWILMAVDKYRHEVPLKAGAKEFLDYCVRNGLKVGVATSNGRELVEAVIESVQIGYAIQVIVTGCEVAGGKPRPDVYLETAKRLGASPEECLVFEDIPAGILAGKRAGMTVIAVADAFSVPLEDEKRRLADGFIDDYYMLL